MAAHDNNDRPRGGNGKWVRTVDTAERDAECARLRSSGMSFRKIAAELKIDVRSAFDGVERCLKAVAVEAADTLRQVELQRLDEELERLSDTYAAVKGVLERKHYTIFEGRVIKYQGAELIDDAVVLQAVDRLVKIEDARRKNGAERRKLMGLDAAQKVSVSGGVKYEVVGVDMEQLR